MFFFLTGQPNWNIIWWKVLYATNQIKWFSKHRFHFFFCVWFWMNYLIPSFSWLTFNCSLIIKLISFTPKWYHYKYLVDPTAENFIKLLSLQIKTSETETFYSYSKHILYTNLYSSVRNIREVRESLVVANIFCREHVIKCLWYIILQIITSWSQKLPNADQFISCWSRNKIAANKILQFYEWALYKENVCILINFWTYECIRQVI